MKDPIFFRRADTLDPETAKYWKDLLYRTIKIGTEIEVAVPKLVSRPEFEAQVRDALQPSGSFERIGTNGVLDVIPEHAGIEIRVIGRQPYFAALHKQYTTITNLLLDKGARPRATCGLHFHLLTPGLAEPVPEIVLANLWNLTRRYAPELRFLTSTGNSREALCRRRNYCSHLEMVRHSPGTMRMKEIYTLLKESRTVPEHQNFLNLQHLGFDEQGNILPFHLEFRFPDADLCALSITAKTFLFLAMTLKAVDMSQYGVIHVGKIVEWRRKVALLDMLSNNDGNLATSDTRAITDEIIEELRVGTRELLDLLAPTFERFDDPAPFDVLLTLAETPISLLRCAGYDWREIETYLGQRIRTDRESELDSVDRQLMQHIDVGAWTGLPSIEAWQWHAARELFLTPQELEHRLERVRALRGLRWDARQGAVVFTS